MYELADAFRILGVFAAGCACAMQWANDPNDMLKCL